METTKILKAFLRTDKEQPHTPSETRLFFTLLGLFQERANEKGQFVATLDEVCKRYGTTCKTHLLKIRETLSKKGIIKCSTTQSKSSIYAFIVSNKNSTIDSNKFSTTQGNKNSTTSSSTPTTQESKIFEALTPFGKIQYHTEAAAKNAPIFCQYVMDLFCTKATLKEIQKFCLYWLKEDEITKQPLHQTKPNFCISDEFRQFQEKRSNM